MPKSQKSQLHLLTILQNQNKRDFNNFPSAMKKIVIDDTLSVKKKSAKSD